MGLVSGCYPLDKFYAARPEAVQIRNVRTHARRRVLAGRSRCGQFSKQVTHDEMQSAASDRDHPGRRRDARAIAGGEAGQEAATSCSATPRSQKSEPGTHNGGGQTVGYSFFDKTPGMTFVFRKRALKPGSGIGYHEQKEDEIYYVLSGRGVMTIDDKAFDVGPGTAVLTRPGSSHGLKQAGDEDLVILINYEQARSKTTHGHKSSGEISLHLIF